MSTEHTLEIRWFGEGEPPPAAGSWIDRLGASSASSRQDRYLVSGDPAMNLKIRGNKVEVKRRVGEPTDVDRMHGISGCIERWIKWSFPLDGPASPSIRGSGPDLWVPVTKRRRQAVLPRDRQIDLLERVGQRIIEPEPVDILAECTVVTCRDTRAWTVNIESKGEPDGLESTLLQILPVVLDDTLAELLAPTDSFGYAHWLRETVENAPASLS